MRDAILIDFLQQSEVASSSGIGVYRQGCDTDSHIKVYAQIFLNYLPIRLDIM